MSSLYGFRVLLIGLSSTLAVAACGMNPFAGGAGVPRGTSAHSLFRPSEPGASKQVGASGEKILYSFQGVPDGEAPEAAVIAEDEGALYGTTTYGGSGTRCGHFDCGAVFKLAPAGSNYTESVLHSFRSSPNDGSKPYANLIADKRGALYGTTFFGGPHHFGTVFKLSPAGSSYTESVIYSFRGPPNDGSSPHAGLMVDKQGTLYGTTFSGGTYKSGTVFKLIRSGSSYTESVIYSFRGPPDGKHPQAGLIADKSGSLYGTTELGGGACGQRGCGIVFKLALSGSGYDESILYSFRDDPDGAYPSAGLTADEGVLYGTTVNGGTGSGTVFRLTPAGSAYTEDVLYRFKGSQDGDLPYGGLIADENRALYGTTSLGGAGSGTVFKLTSAGSGYTESVVYSFQGKPDGAYPLAGLIADRAGALYGTTQSGGDGPCVSGCGTVFKIVP